MPKAARIKKEELSYFEDGKSHAYMIDTSKCDVGQIKARAKATLRVDKVVQIMSISRQESARNFAHMAGLGKCSTVKWEHQMGER